MNEHFSRALLESALAGNLPADDETALNHHLASCETCSTALERLAGGADWCQEAAALLATDELDTTLPTCEKWSEVDFTVEHLEPADEPNMLGRLGGYDVLQIIGHGGMGVVLKAFDRDLKRAVAIKVLAPHLAQSALAKQRFAREAQASAAIVHPNVLAIHQVQAGGRLPFLVMPLVAGESLAERLTAQGTLELKEILRIGMQAAAGLAAAHEQGLVHRDVKPANILLEKGVERAVLTDFGLARAADDVALTRWGIIAGTPQYMSPEQARGEPLDGRSDLFSLGCVLYEMATGVSPFRADSMLATMRRLVDDPPQSMTAIKPELPPWFVAIVDRLLEKDPSRRFGSAKEVSELLEGCLAHVQQPAGVPLPEGVPMTTPGEAKSASSKWRARWFKIIGALILVGLVGIEIFLAATAEPSDISGVWTGDDWGRVVLKPSGTSEYTGTYTDTFKKEPGKIELKWSRIERRYNGTWSEGKDRFGKISVRKVSEDIRGGWTTNRKSEINPGTPELADLLWTRLKPEAVNERPTKNLTFGPVIERTLNDPSVDRRISPPPMLNLETGDHVNPPDDLRDFDNAKNWAQTHGADLIACGDGGGRGLRIIGGLAIQPANWDASSKEVAEAIDSTERGLDSYKKTIAGFQDPRELGFANLWAADNYKATFFIKTRNGTIGTLQITEFNDGPANYARRAPNGSDWEPVVPHRVTFRYKLLTKETTAGQRPAAPAALVAPVRDADLSWSAYRLDCTISKPRHVILGVVQFIDERHSVSIEMPRLAFYFITPNQVADAKAQLTWRLSDVTEGEGAWNLRMQGSIGDKAVFDRNLVLAGGKPFLALYGTPDRPDHGPELGLDPKAVSWEAVQPERPFWIEAGDVSARKWTWNTLKLFEARDQEKRIVATIQLKLIACPLDTARKYDWAEPTLKCGDWEKDDQLQKALGKHAEKSALEIPAPSDQSNTQKNGESAPDKPISDAVRQFNTRAEWDPIGKDQPPLTEDELRGAIYSLVHAENDRFSTDEKQEFGKAAASGRLPENCRLDVDKGIFGADGERFKAWMIQLRWERDNGTEPAYTVRHQLICQEDTNGDPIPLPNVPNSVQADDGATPLAAAINGFNAAHNSVRNVRQTPLTEEEVVAAIRWWKTRRNDAPVTNGEFAQFQKIADTRELPKGAEFEVIPDFIHDDGTEHFIWSVRIKMPQTSKPGWTYAYEIRRQYVHSEGIDDVIRKEQTIAWGSVAPSGLQAGVRLEPQKDSYATGQQVTPVFYYRNGGKAALETSFPNLMTHSYYNKLIAVDAAEKPFTIDQDPDPTGPVGWVGEPLAPGAQHEIKGLPIVLGDVDRGAAETVIRASADDSVHLHFELPNPVEKNAPALPTGEVMFSIK